MADQARRHQVVMVLHPPPPPPQPTPQFPTTTQSPTHHPRTLTTVVTLVRQSLWVELLERTRRQQWGKDRTSNSKPQRLPSTDRRTERQTHTDSYVDTSSHHQSGTHPVILHRGTFQGLLNMVSNQTRVFAPNPFLPSKKYIFKWTKRKK